MATYVYGCADHEEIRVEVTHGMNENPVIPCPACRKPMHRIPQAFRFYMNPQLLLLEKLGERFNEMKKERKYGIKRKHARGESI